MDVTDTSDSTNTQICSSRRKEGGPRDTRGLRGRAGSKGARVSGMIDYFKPEKGRKREREKETERERERENVCPVMEFI